MRKPVSVSAARRGKQKLIIEKGIRTQDTCLEKIAGGMQNMQTQYILESSGKDET
jgi:hypothetical protein